MICWKKHTVWLLNPKELVHFGFGFFFCFVFFLFEFDLAIFQRGNHRWTVTGLGGKKGLYRLDPPPIKNSAGFPPPQSRGIFSSPGGCCWSSEGFHRRSLHPREWWPRRRSTQLFLNVWHFSQASILTCDRERRGLQHPPIPFTWRFAPRSYCKSWKRGPGPCWFFLLCFQPRFHLFEKMRKYFIEFSPIEPLRRDMLLYIPM